MGANPSHVKEIARHEFSALRIRLLYDDEMRHFFFSFFLRAFRVCLETAIGPVYQQCQTYFDFCGLFLLNFLSKISFETMG